jgi:hypothetical protein
VALTTYNISGSILDALGVWSATGEVVLVPVVDMQTRVDGGDVLLGSQRYTINPNPSLHNLPASLPLTAGGWRVIVRPTGTGAGAFPTFSAAFDLQANTTWGAIASGVLGPPPDFAPTVDDAVSAVINTGGKTSQALAGVIASEVDTPGTAARDALDDTFASQEPFRSPVADMAFTSVTTNLIAMSLGSDDGVYGSNALGLALRRNLTGFTGADEAGPTLAAAAGQDIHFATRTAEGYVAVTGNITSDVGEIWFSTSWATGWTKVKDIRNAENFTISRPMVDPIGGGTVIVVGEYASGGTQARELWLTRNGGQTWTGINPMAAVDSASNNHWHAAQCKVVGGAFRIYAAHGDKANAWFGYTDNYGATWVNLPAKGLKSAHEHAQPTVLVPLRHGVANCGDAGGRGMDTGVLMTAPDSGVTWRAHNGAAGIPDFHQWGRGPWAGDGDLTAYVTFPQATGFYTSGYHYIAATGDGGRSWHTVWTQEAPSATDRDYNNGIVGPDSQGRIFMSTKEATVRQVLVSTGVTWKPAPQRAMQAAATGGDIKDVLVALGFLPNADGPTNLDLDTGFMLAGDGSGVDGPTGTNHGFTLYSDGVARWHIQVMSDAETGSDLGSSLAIAPVRDNGTVGGNLLTVYRNGEMRVGAAGGKIGFFGGVPTTKPSAATAASGVTAGDVYTTAERDLLNNLKTRQAQIINRLNVLGLMS